MNRHLKRILVLSLGIFCILLGILGVVLPILQGVPFLILGVLIISLYSPKLREWLDRRTKPYPKLNEVIEKAEAWIIKVIGRP